MSVTITLTKHSNTWTSDGTEVTTKKLGDDSWEKFILNRDLVESLEEQC